MKNPTIIKNLLSDIDRSLLIDDVSNYKQFDFQSGFSRYAASESMVPRLDSLANKLMPIAKQIFGSNTLMPTYTLFVHYEGDNPAPSLYKHKDDNACTYTLDLCLYQTEPWDLWVDNNKYTLQENEALAYYGNEQLHWREKFPNPGNQHVAMVFFHFAEPEHWWFKKGPSYLSVIRGQITEDQWKNL